MKNQTIKTIENYINNEFTNVEPIDYFDMAPQSFHSFYGGYKPSYHIDNGDYSQEAYDLFFNSELVHMCDALYCDYHMEMEAAIKNNPTEYGFDEDDEWVQDEDFQFDEDGVEYSIFTNYFISLVQEALEDAPVEAELVKYSIKHSEFSADNEIYVEVKVTYLGVTDTYSKLGSDSAEPYNGSHSTDFQESDKLWDAIDEIMANIELSKEEKQELYGEMAYLY